MQKQQNQKKKSTEGLEKRYDGDRPKPKGGLARLGKMCLGSAAEKPGSRAAYSRQYMYTYTKEINCLSFGIF
jgi:hypothetical protein